MADIRPGRHRTMFQQVASQIAHNKQHSNTNLFALSRKRSNSSNPRIGSGTAIRSTHRGGSGTGIRAIHRSASDLGGNRSRSKSSITNGSSSLDDMSTGSEGDGDHHKQRKKGLKYQKTENVITRVRDIIAQCDVFITRKESPPFIESLKLSIWFLPVLFILCVWDTIAIFLFEIPYLCWNNFPCVLLVWHIGGMLLAMYGFMLSYLSSGMSSQTKLAALSLGLHYLLLAYRILMEIFFNGYRSQTKLYIETIPHVKKVEVWWPWEWH